MKTIFSDIEDTIDGPLTDLAGGSVQDEHPSAEWFAWLISQLTTEAVRIHAADKRQRRFCYLIVERCEGPGYIQFAAGDDGSLCAEVASNQSLDCDVLLPSDELLLESKGWDRPTTATTQPP